MKPATFGATVTSIALLSASAQASVMSFQEGNLVKDGVQISSTYTHVAAEIREAVPTNNFGAVDRLFIGEGVPSVLRLRGVFSFDLSSLPANATIDDVSLTLTINGARNSTPDNLGELELHQLLQTPAEGELNGTNAGSTHQGVTWNRASRDFDNNVDNNWTTPGGDFSATVLSTVTGFNTDLTGVGTPKTFASSNDFVLAVEGLKDGNGNFGALNLIVLSPSTEANPSGDTWASFSSNENATLARRPRLEITYTVPEPTAAATCLIGLGGLLARRRRG